MSVWRETRLPWIHRISSQTLSVFKVVAKGPVPAITILTTVMIINEFLCFLNVRGDAVRVILPGQQGGVSEGCRRAIVPPASLACPKGTGLQTDQPPHRHMGGLQRQASDTLGSKQGPTMWADLEHSGNEGGSDFGSHS